VTATFPLGGAGALTTATRAGGRRLYLDGMNCAEWFLGDGAADHALAVRAMPGRARDFMAAAEAAGFTEVAVFIDAARVTDEAREKWKERRLREVCRIVIIASCTFRSLSRD